MMKQNFPLNIVLKKITKFQWFATISICFTHKNAKADVLHPVACLIYLRMEKWGCLMPSFHSGSWWCLASGMHIFLAEICSQCFCSAQLSWSHRVLGFFIWSPTQHCVIGNCCEKMAFAHLSTCLWLWILQLANVSFKMLYLSEPKLMVQRTKRQMYNVSLFTNTFPFLFKNLAFHGCSPDFTYLVISLPKN